MNEAAKIISSSLLGEDSLTVILGKKNYYIYPPTIKALCRAIREFSQVKDTDKIDPDSYEHILKGVSVLIKGNPDIDPTEAELTEAMAGIYRFISPTPFLNAVSLAKNVAEMAAKMKQ